MDRIATYLDEEEVDEQVSTLKKAESVSTEDVAKGLGIENGTFRWNEVQQPKDDQSKKTTSTNGSSGTAGDDDAATAVDSASVAEYESDRRFELTNLTVMFPEGELTVVTGPTASGKTALLVRNLVPSKMVALNTAQIDGTAWRDDANRREAYHVEGSNEGG